MKKTLLLALTIFLNFLGFAQSEQSLTITEDQKMFFFKSYDDYIAKKPVEGIKLVSMSQKGWNIEVNQNGVIEKIKDSKILYPYFCWGSDLMRVFDGEIYFVLDIGPLCFYKKIRECSVSYKDDRSFYYFNPTGDDIHKEYYSETINGEIKVMKHGVFEDYLEKYGLKEAFDKEKKPKREKKDSVVGYKNKEWNVWLKYKKILNQKMK